MSLYLQIMKILTGINIKGADKATISKEPITSIDLMERASATISQWIAANIESKYPLLIMVGKGNNGGDGLAIARMLHHAGYRCSVYLSFETSKLSVDCKENLARLPEGITIRTNISDINPDFVIIDALLGTGVEGAIEEPLYTLIRTINSLPNKIISIDLPSGMNTEFGNFGQKIIAADITLTLEFPKLAMLLPEAGEYCGQVVILPIGLDKHFIHIADTPFWYVDKEFIKNILLRRKKFAHKNTYGHALLICGSKGMSGAAVLATGASLRSGCGLVTLHIPADERVAVQVSYPSAILSLDKYPHFSELPSNIVQYNAIGIGSGLGQKDQSIKAFKQLLETTKSPLVIDADALNILASQPDMLQYIPQGSILTPHVGEARRLLGEWGDEIRKINLVRAFAEKYNVIFILKGANTMTCLPNGSCFFNSTGNSGMAKGGSGDVLTGLITGLLSRGYSSEDAAFLGVYIHGLAGDKAAEKLGLEAMNSNDLIDYIPQAFADFKE